MQRILPVFLTVWLLAQALGLPAYATEAAPCSPDPVQPGQGCSVIYATDGELMLGGNNEDYFNPLTKVWFIPAGAGAFGRVYFGFNDYHAQGGMNDQGLFFDGLGLGDTFPVATEGKERYLGNLVDKAMSECATVDCAVGLFEQYYTRDAWWWQHLFGDATGESAIIEAGTAIRQRGGYQVATNFAQSVTPPEESRCWRYETAVEQLEGMDALSVDFMRDLLDAVHQDGPAHTLYSNVYDLKNKLVYLYYFYNYDEPVVLDLEEELAQGYHVYNLPSLFPLNTAAEDWAKPKLRKYETLIESGLDDSLDPAVLQAYAGEYETPEGWGPPGMNMTVIAGEQSLLLRFPDYRQHELFPESATGFYHVAFQESTFVIAYNARFILNENRRIEYLELFSDADPVRLARVGAESFVPEVATGNPTITSSPAAGAAPTDTPTATPTPTSSPTATPAPTATATASARPTATAAPTSTATPNPTLTSDPAAGSGPTGPDEASPSEPGEGAGFPWAWLILPLALAGAAGAWMALRRRG
jgi:hypothetical protein